MGPLFDLTVDDAARGFALSSEIGWNQTIDDWRYMLAHGEGVGKNDENGKLVASAMALPYGEFAWICMVLVADTHRRRGLATELMGAVIDRQTRAGRVPGLDATPAGREVYRQIGFRNHYGIGRYRAEAVVSRGEIPAGVELRPLTAEDADSVASFDRSVFGADRGALLQHLTTRQPARAFAAFRDAKITGYVLARDGREATQIGPVVAGDGDTAIALAARAATNMAGPCYVDAPDEHVGFLDWLNSAGFVFQRPFTRMYLDRDTGFDRPSAVFAIAGPELG